MDPLYVILDTIRKNDSLSESEKDERIRKAKELMKDILYERPCDKCQNKCYSPNSCEYCMKDYLRLQADSSKWTSDNDEIDDFIKTLQQDFKRVDHIIEWIPHRNLQNIRYTTEGNYIVRIEAIWEEGRFESWDYEAQRLKRLGPQGVAIRMVNRNYAVSDQWIQEIKAHLFLSSIMAPVVHGYGLTKDERTGNYMIITEKTDRNLKNYLQHKLQQLDWFQKYKILLDILESLESIHNNKFVHGNLNSGAIKYSSRRENWLIGDFRFCRPSNSPMSLSVIPNESFGTMAYVAPELLENPSEKMTVSSDIYSFGMIMWEVSTGYRPFDDRRHTPEEEIIRGLRPDIMNGTPDHYSELMKKCWSADRKDRPKLEDIKNAIKNTIDDVRKSKSSRDIEIMNARRSLVRIFVDIGVQPGPESHGCVKIVDYSKISNEKILDGFWRVSSADYQQGQVAIKTIQIDSKSDKSSRKNQLQKLIQEINRWEDMYQHPNIMEILGVGAKAENKLFMVMPFANGGNLREYLKNKNNRLNFREKVDIASDITSGIEILHEHDIVHENLNPNNILIFDGIAKISNLPLPLENELRSMDQYIDEDIFNNIGYIDPSSFSIGGYTGNYNKNKSVDIYSLGSLLWEIESEKIPYSKDQSKEGGLKELFKRISEGHREREDVAKDRDIPAEYIRLYHSCWSENISSRPAINDVRRQLLDIRNMLQ